MTYEHALKIIKDKQKSLGIKPGLERVLSLLDVMGNPQDKIKVIHVAGTNGKGTVAAGIANALTRSGYKTGIFTSPWVTDYREQIMLDGREISRDDFARYVEKYCKSDCTEFELLTAVMYKYFADCAADYAVVECGMGGRGDATNTEKQNIAVITSVSLDHTDFLGSTVEEIALEKSGIIKENGTCILYPNPDCDRIFENVCKKKNARLIRSADCGSPLLNNRELAKTVLTYVGCGNAFESIALPARREKIGRILLDGGHNASAAQLLAKIISDEIAVIGMMRDKDVDGYLSAVAPRCKKIIAVTPDNPRALPARELVSIAGKYCADVTVFQNPCDAVRQDGVTLVCGSFYLAREVRDILHKMI